MWFQAQSAFYLLFFFFLKLFIEVRAGQRGIWKGRMQSWLNGPFMGLEFLEELQME